MEFSIHWTKLFTITDKLASLNVLLKLIGVVYITDFTVEPILLV